MAEETPSNIATVTSAEEAAPVKKQRKARKPRSPKTKAEPKGAKKGHDVDLEISNEEEEPLPPHYVLHEGSTITLNGTDVKLQVMTLEQQKEHDIKSITGEMGKKCKTPIVITFKTPKAALAFFNGHCFPEDEDAALGFIEDGPKVEWDSPSMTVSM